MAQLKDTVVQGTLSATDALISTSVQTGILRVPSSSNSTTYGPGTNGQLLRSNGTKAYWGTLAATDIPDVYIKKAGNNDGIMTGTLTLHGLKGTADIDYGTTLPTSPTTGQIFFQISDPWYELPPVNSSDNGKILSVVNGVWASSNSLTTLSNNLGNLSSLTTTTKSSAVAAINEVKAGVSANSDAIASLGTVLTGTWTATSSAATLVQLTQAITLTKGTWLVVITVPYADSGTPVVTFGPQSPYMDNQQMGVGQASGSQAFRILTVETTQQVYAMSGGSAAVSYSSSYLARGGIKAIKIGM